MRRILCRLCNKISAIFGGHDALLHPTFLGGLVPPVPRGIYATGLGLGLGARESFIADYKLGKIN